MGKRIIIQESMLKPLLEEMVLLEVKSDFAYEKFYSSIPREDFDKITGGARDIDKFVQFFLNSVRDGECDVDTACNVLEGVKNADNLVRQKIKNKFGAGEYKTVAAISDDLYYFSNGGTVLSAKSFAKQTYEVLAENERWVATCTKSWTANNKYFGKFGAHWCTASDRNGEYDGYKMFNTYTSDLALIQYRWKGKVKEFEKGKDNLNTTKSNYPESYFDQDEGFIGEILNERDAMFQFSLRNSNGSDVLPYIRDCENTLNKGCGSLKGVKDFVGTEMISLLTNKELIDRLIKETDETRSIERDYVNIAEKRREEESERKKRIVQAECDRLDADIINEVNKKWENFVNSKEYENVESFRSVISHNREFVRSSYHIRCGGNELIVLNPAIQRHVPVPNREEMWVVGLGFVSLMPEKSLVILKSENSVKTLGEFNGYNEVKAKGIYCTVGPSRFVILSGRRHGDNGIAFSCFIDLQEGFVKELDETTKQIAYLTQNDSDYCFFIGAAHKKALLLSCETFDDSFIYDSDTRSITKLDSNKAKFVGYEQDSALFILNYEGKQYATHGNMIVPVDFIKTVEEICWVSWVDYAGATLWGLKFTDGTYNTYNSEENELLFGVFGVDEPRLACLPIVKNGQKFDLHYQDYGYGEGGSYYIVREGDYRNRLECDKNGITTLDRNMKAHQNAGIYDRGEDWGRAAMKDYPNKVPLSAEQMKNAGFIPDTMLGGWWKFAPGKNAGEYFNKVDWEALDKLPENEKLKKDKEIWLGAVNAGYILKPNEYGEVNGKSYDWWDPEDEVPAKLSDRPIREEFERMKSLWDRMGLND